MSAMDASSQGCLATGAHEQRGGRDALVHAILATAGPAIITIDAQGWIVYWNRAAERMFGYGSAEALGRTLDYLLPERHRAEHREHVAWFTAESMGARPMDHRSAVGLRKNGEEFPISAMLAPFEHEGKLFVTVDVRDVTDQRRIEAAEGLLADLGDALLTTPRETALERLVRASVRRLAEFAVLFVLNDAHQLRRAASASRAPALDWAAEEMLCSPERLPGSHPLARAVADRVTLCVEHDPASYTELAVSPEHLRALRAAEPRTTLVVPLVSAGACLGVLAWARRAPKFDAAEQSVAEEVARRVALFLENERLRKAERRALELRDEVLAAVAHDLRHPLNAILLSVHALQRSAPAGPAAGSALSLIRSEGWRMNRLINDLLDVATLDAGLPLRLRLQPVSVVDLVAECLERHRESMRECSQVLDLQLGDDLPKIPADRDRLDRVLDNLLGNAVKFAPAGSSIHLSIRVEGEELVLKLQNGGEAISPEGVACIFDRFWQAQAGDRRGRGLGLFIVKTVVTQHGGTVSVESTPDRGTTFRIALPLTAVPEP